jgi:hypothetical protein
LKGCEEERKGGFRTPYISSKKINFIVLKVLGHSQLVLLSKAEGRRGKELVSEDG